MTTRYGMSRMVFVHGFNVRDGGARTVDRLEPLARSAGYLPDVDTGEYGYFGLLSLRCRRKRRRQKVILRLARAFAQADIIVTHSNGANFANQALNVLGKAHDCSKFLIHISPALDSDAKVPRAVNRQLVLATPHDFLVKLSSLLIRHPWGAMGARGYTGKDPRVTTVMVDSVGSHSGWFKAENLRDTFTYIHNFIQDQRR